MGVGVRERKYAVNTAYKYNFVMCDFVTVYFGTHLLLSKPFSGLVILIFVDLIIVC